MAAARKEGTLTLYTSITAKDLLDAGVHFGHQTKRWNPKMKEYIFGERNGIYIIDLQKTLKLFKDAMRYVGEMAAQGKTVLFVGTKRQAQEAIAEETVRIIRTYKDTGKVPNVVNLAKQTPATHMLVVRHRDKPGVLADITRILAASKISIDAMVQKEPGEGEKRVDIVLLTHRAIEKNVDAALKKIGCELPSETVETPRAAGRRG